VFAFTRRFTGLLIMLLGAWGGILPYVGPLFGYRMDNTGAWAWTTPHWELNLAAGALVFLGGMFILFGWRPTAVFGGLLSLIGGAWLVVGPLFASIWLHTAAQTRVASSSWQAAMRPLGYHYGTGLVIVALSAWVIGRKVLVTGPVVEGSPPAATARRRRRRTVAAEPAGVAAPGAGSAGAAPDQTVVG
jgi:hypothetical protein